MIGRRALLSTIQLALALTLGCTGSGGRGDAGVRIPRPTRALWVDSWGPGLGSPEECDAMVEAAAAAGFDTILVEVRKVGDAYYSSRLEPRGNREPRSEPIEAAFDPLERILAKARIGKGLRVEAWIVANRVWKGTLEPAPGAPAHLVHRRPDWLLQDRFGDHRDRGAESSIYVDPSDPEARAWVAKIAADVAGRYAVDAIHLDYIRYPGKDWGYGERSLARYAAERGRTATPAPDDPEFTAWRARQVTEEVREIRTAIRARRAAVELTAAVVAWGAPDAEGYHATRGYREACQDWPSWCEEGLLDAVYPMHYKREAVADQARDFRAWLDDFAAMRSRSSARFVIGLGAYLNTAEDTRRQIAEVESRGFDGIAVFSYRHPEKEARGSIGPGLLPPPAIGSSPRVRP